jgi:hypothetical protein
MKTYGAARMVAMENCPAQVDIGIEMADPMDVSAMWKGKGEGDTGGKNGKHGKADKGGKNSKGKAKDGEGKSPDGKGKGHDGEGQERAVRRPLHLLQEARPQAAGLLGQGARNRARQHCHG